MNKYANPMALSGRTQIAYTVEFLWTGTIKRICYTPNYRISWALIILPRYNLYKFCPALLMKFPDRPDIDPLWRKILSPVKIWTLARNDFHSSLQSRLYTLPPLLASRYLRAKHLCSRGSPITATSLCEISTSLTQVELWFWLLLRAMEIE